jgi:hypothetical protein
VCMLTALTTLAPIAMSFADPWGDIFKEKCWLFCGRYVQRM